MKKEEVFVTLPLHLCIFLHNNVVNKLTVQAQNENIRHVTLIPSKNKCLSVFVLCWRSGVHERLNGSWDNAGFVAMCCFQ